MAKEKTTVPNFEDTGLPESYRAEYLANPWVGQSAPGVGAQRRADQLKLQTSANQYVADLTSRAHEEEYNDPLRSSQRLRLAGYNPDLAGFEGAGQAGQAPSVSQFPDTDFTGRASDVASVMLNLFSMFTGVPNAIADLRGKMIDNRSALLEQLGGVIDLVDDDASNIRPILDLPDDASLPNLLAAGSVASSRSSELAQILFPNDKRMRKTFVDLYSKRRNTLSNQLKRFTSLKDIFNLENSPEFNDADTLRTMARLYSLYQLESLQNKAWYEHELAKFHEAHPDFMQDQLTADMEKDLSVSRDEKKRADYDAGVVDKLDPEKQATAINESSSAQAMESITTQYRERQNQTDFKVISKLKDYFEDPGAFNTDKWYKDNKKGSFLWHRFGDEFKMAREKRKYKNAYRRQYGKQSKGFKLTVPGVGSLGYSE